jgi:ribonuclease D
MPLELIDHPKVAGNALGGMSGVREIAVDTEGASFHRFVDRVYLLQLSTRQTSAIIDPLAVPAAALAPLGSLLESPDVETVFHDADYDLRLLRRDYGWKIRRIFDTRIASQLLGTKAFGLAALLEKYFGVKLDKKHQRADWSMRPLPRDMLDYAEQDTRYLLELKDKIREELEKKGRLAWVREECDRLEDIKWSDEDSVSAFMKVKGARDLSRRELAVFGELHAWRDSVAKELDRATFRVIGNEQLLEMAKTQPSSTKAITDTKGVSRGLVDRRGNEILDAVKRGLAVPEADLPKYAKAPRWDRDPHFDGRLTKVKAVRDEVAVKLDLDPGVLCARERMEAVARKNPQSPEQLAEITELRRWQAEVLGPGFLAALKK